MKKIYAHILLTAITTLSTTCMELQLERKKTEPLNIQSQSSIALPTNSKLYSFDTLNNLQLYSAPSFAESFLLRQGFGGQVGGHSEAEFILSPVEGKSRPAKSTTIQKKYTDLDYVPVYVSTDPNEIELTPVYKPIEGSTTEYFDCINKKNISSPQKDQKPINTYLIERLHNSARDFLYYLDATAISKPYNTEDFAQSQGLLHPNNATRDKKLVMLIKLMNTAKYNGITEDFMGNFSYEQYCKLTHRYAAYGLAPLVFSCLKRYMLTIHDSKEQLVLDVKDLSDSHPAYDNLVENTKQMFAHGHYIIIPYLYANAKTLSTKDKLYNHISTLKEFCETFHSLQSQTYTIFQQRIWNYLDFIKQIKNLKNIEREKDLGNAILTFERQQTLKEKLLCCPKYDYSIDNKNRLAMFCIYAEKYFQTCSNKITPDCMQYCIWQIQNYTHIALPDSFDTNLLDKNYYALEELHELTNNLLNLNKNSTEDIQRLVDQHYIFNEQ
ncbi:MAG TPA: hypothetical protein VHX42_01275 [Candidatus Babeliales bacterium]|jgi:hypothetical protein|nr:hypothetical protein [Candidatus Babeliales bacterium]